MTLFTNPRRRLANDQLPDAPSAIDLRIAHRLMAVSGLLLVLAFGALITAPLLVLWLGFCLGALLAVAAFAVLTLVSHVCFEWAHDQLRCYRPSAREVQYGYPRGSDAA
jgi:uncharacterized membrane protein